MTDAIENRLFASLDPVRLRGSACGRCDTTTFPAQVDCPRCADRTMVDVELPTRGRLWTWTLQAFEPKAPYVSPASGFEPFCVGYVDLGTVVVEARIHAPFEVLSAGLPMRLVAIEVPTGDGPRLCHAFVPTEDAP